MPGRTKTVLFLCVLMLLVTAGTIMTCPKDMITILKDLEFGYKLSLTNFTPELSQLNQDFYPRYKLGLTLPRNCRNLTRIFTPGINWV